MSKTKKLPWTSDVFEIEKRLINAGVMSQKTIRTASDLKKVKKK